MDANVDDESTAVGPRRALGDHATTCVGDSIDLDAVDTADGEKIVNHVYLRPIRSSPSRAAAAACCARLLPILAPIVMGYLAKQAARSLSQSGIGRGAARWRPVRSGRWPRRPPRLACSAAARPQGGGRRWRLLGDILGGPWQAAPSSPTTSPQVPASPVRAGRPGFRRPGRRRRTASAWTATGIGSPRSRAAQAAAGSGAGDLLGGILQDILLRRPELSVDVVLASASPARLQTLRRAGVDPVVHVSGVDEGAVDRADASPTWPDAGPAQGRGRPGRRSAPNADLVLVGLRLAARPGRRRGRQAGHRRGGPRALARPARPRRPSWSPATTWSWSATAWCTATRARPPRRLRSPM